MKKLQILVWKIIKKLPAPLRAYHSRKIFHTDLNHNEGVLKDVIYKVATTYDEYLQAFKLVQDNYKRLNMTGSDEHIRASKFNLLPTTTVLIAVHKGEVIATISLVLDSSLGLPTDEYQDVSPIRETGARIVEISALTVKEEWRSRSRGLFVPLTIYSVYYGKNLMGAEYAVISIRKSVKSFYQDIYLFKDLGMAKKYEGVNNLESVSMYMNFEELLEESKVIYRNYPPEKNPYYLLKEFPWKEKCELSLPKYNLITKHLFTNEEVKSFFETMSKVIDNLEDKDKNIIKNYYCDESVLQDIKSKYDEIMAKRNYPRFQVNLDAKLTSGTSIVSAKVLDVSLDGLCLFTKDNISEDKTYHAVVNLAPGINSKLRLKKQWERAGHRFGFTIESVEDQNWNQMINYFNEYLFSEVEREAQKKKAS